MTLLCVGLDHLNAPMSLLAQAALDSASARTLLLDVAADEYVAETFVVATCNRLEVYADVDRFHPAIDAITELLAKRTGVDREELVDHLHVRYDEAAVVHLFGVAAGLESVVPGETQVLGQVRSALRSAQDEGTTGRSLNAVAQHALRTGKRVHSETAVAAAGASVVSASLDLVAPHVGGLAGRHAVVVGAGAMGLLATATLRRADAASITIVNRTAEHAEHIAASYGADVAGLEDLPALLLTADVVVTAVGSGHVLLNAAFVGSARERPLAIVDLGLPADTDADLALVPGVLRIDLETLHNTSLTQTSTEDLASARAIVREEAEAFATAHAARGVEPTLVALRAMAADVVATESRRLRNRLPDLTAEEFEDVERSLRRSVSALLHTPTVRIKEYAVGPEGSVYAEALRALFDLDPTTVRSLERD